MGHGRQGGGQRAAKIVSFDLAPGQRIGDTYRVEEFLGGGLEGEVYRVTELQTRVRRAAKLFYPQQNQGNRAARVYAQKLDRLRHCPIVIQYHHAETLAVGRTPVTCLVSEYVDGILLSDFVAAHPGRRLPPFKALHLLYALARGLEQIHACQEYHGDLHAGNILVRPRGIFFEVRLVDFHHLGQPSAAHRRDDIVDLALRHDRRPAPLRPPAPRGQGDLPGPQARPDQAGLPHRRTPAPAPGELPGAQPGLRRRRPGAPGSAPVRCC
jgi:serine/threonine protein kinase